MGNSNKYINVLRKLSTFELELENFDSYLIKNWPMSKEGKIYFKNAIKNDFVVVAEVDNAVVGYLMGGGISVPYYNFKIAELFNMCIDSNYRNQGIGNALYSEFEKFYRSQGVSHFMVTASFKNESAKQFYKKMGFNEANLTLVKL